MKQNLKIWQQTKRKINTLVEYERNPRKITQEAVEKLKKSILELGFYNPIILNENGQILAGHQRFKVLIDLGLGDLEIPVMLPPKGHKLTKKEVRRIVLMDNKSWGTYDVVMIKEDFTVEEFEEWGFNEINFERQGNDPDRTGNMQKDFLIPPFSVLDTKQGYWQDRKRSWIKIGIESDEGREELKSTMIATEWMKRGKDSGGSIFDPVLCEIVYTWFSPVGGKVLDPFAGGSVRGIVAGKLGRHYTGVDLRPEQVKINQAQAKNINLPAKPVWKVGDSTDIKKIVGGGASYDLLFSCPPYSYLEVYSDDPADLSNMSYSDFKKAYAKIIKESYDLLKEDRFACFVVGEIRNKQGNYHCFVPDTIAAFLNAGFEFYNEAILVNAVGSLPMRTPKQFRSARKMGKQHQNVLVFVKGDGKKAAKACGDIKIMGVETENEVA